VKSAEGVGGATHVTTFLSGAEVEAGAVEGATAIVIDVIRATSTIVEALASGARAVYPTVLPEEAVRLANSLGRDDTLLTGERKGLMIDGFDLGNSPSEYTPERVGGMRLVMTTTNGTRAFVAAEGAARVIAASLSNLTAVARAVVGADRLVFICAGREDRFSLDDAICAGLVLRALGKLRKGPPMQLDDASQAVRALAGSFRVDSGFLGTTAAGKALIEVGLGADLEHCALIDRHDLVPEMQDRMIRLPDGP
jgi:2-phosphosulfolactate phosphatase